MALVIAALCARGESVIHNIRQVERGLHPTDTAALNAALRRKPRPLKPNPAPAKARLRARPMPSEAPVMMITLPVKAATPEIR